MGHLIKHTGKNCGEGVCPDVSHQSISVAEPQSLSSKSTNYLALESSLVSARVIFAANSVASRNSVKVVRKSQSFNYYNCILHIAMAVLK